MLNCDFEAGCCLWLQLMYVVYLRNLLCLKTCHLVVMLALSCWTEQLERSWVSSGNGLGSTGVSAAQEDTTVCCLGAWPNWSAGFTVCVWLQILSWLCQSMQPVCNLIHLRDANWIIQWSVSLLPVKFVLFLSDVSILCCLKLRASSKPHLVWQLYYSSQSVYSTQPEMPPHFPAFLSAIIWYVNHQTFGAIHRREREGTTDESS